MASPETVIVRRRYFPDSKIVVETKSFKLDKWYNAIYLKFQKEDYPHFKYPGTKEDSFNKEILHFEYYRSSFIELDFHCGISYYSEKMLFPNDSILVSIGADYNHLYDDDYGLADFGKEILVREADKLVTQFLELSKPKKDNEPLEEFKLYCPIDKEVHNAKLTRTDYEKRLKNSKERGPSGLLLGAKEKYFKNDYL